MSSMEVLHTPPAATLRDWDKKNLIGLTLPQLQKELQSVPGIKSYTAKQIYGFMYKRGVTDFADMQNIPISIRHSLKERYVINYGRVVKLVRNLTADEIVGQYMIAAKDYHDMPQVPNMQRNVGNIVFMGQGEPLYNWRNVKQAIEILTDKDGIGLPKAKITVSTSGVAPGIYKLAELGGISLAISLHAISNDLRDEIVPINKYVMLKDVNDSFAEARELARLLKDIPSHVNLIPFNPWPGSKYTSSPRDHIVGFSRIVEEHGVATTIRWPRGKDVLAACGQLRSSIDKDGIKDARK
ncbi:hypothetical protein BGW42_005519 [Actinomortierella wolfii]|nr:hypothetical protein BGW42_005519 [Actinomortierella wolfii]